MPVLKGNRTRLTGTNDCNDKQPVLGRDLCPGAWQRRTIDAECHLQTVCLVAAWPSRIQHSPGHPQLRGLENQGSFT